MRLASVKPDNLAVVKDDRLISIGHLLPKGASMIDLIARCDTLKAEIEGIGAMTLGVARES